MKKSEERITLTYKSTKMKQQTNASARKSIVQNGIVVPISSIGILADSIEVKEQYCREKVQYFEHALVALNVFENALEIVAICKEMKRYKNELLRIAERRKP
jgi:hypothetical protein